VTQQLLKEPIERGRVVRGRCRLGEPSTPSWNSPDQSPRFEVNHLSDHNAANDVGDDHELAPCRPITVASLPQNDGSPECSCPSAAYGIAHPFSYAMSELALLSIWIQYTFAIKPEERSQTYWTKVSINTLV